MPTAGRSGWRASQGRGRRSSSRCRSRTRSGTQPGPAVSRRCSGGGRIRPAYAAEGLPEGGITDGLADQLDVAELQAERLQAEPRGGDEQNRDVTQRRVVQLNVAEVPAVQDGHHHIEQDGGRTKTISQELEGLVTVG